jgi:hypothetical protein
MKYIIKVKSIEEYEVEADSKEVDTINELYHIPDGNDYNYTGYRPFSNRDYERMQGTNISYRTNSSVFSIRK